MKNHYKRDSGQKAMMDKNLKHEKQRNRRNIFIALICVILFQIIVYYRSAILLQNWISTNENSKTIDISSNIEEKNDIKTIDASLNMKNNDTYIRRWGCNRNETPFIFIHIGKSGGGSILSQMEVSVISKQKFCKNKFREKDYNQCNASTPIGMAIACPLAIKDITQCRSCNPLKETCEMAYGGHSFLGYEMRYLPQFYLTKWWKSNYNLLPQFPFHQLNGNNSKFLPILNAFKTLQPRNDQWCITSEANFSRLFSIEDQMRYHACSTLIQPYIDDLAYQHFFHSTIHNQIDWSFLYASMPVLRSIVVREPFSWLLSKLFWHFNKKKAGEICDNIDIATNASVIGRSLQNNLTYGWADRYSTKYLIYLCGVGKNVFTH